MEEKPPAAPSKMDFGWNLTHLEHHGNIIQAGTVRRVCFFLEGGLIMPIQQQNSCPLHPQTQCQALPCLTQPGGFIANCSNNVQMFHVMYILYFRLPCSIEVPGSDNVVIAGGWISGSTGITRVVKYSAQGAATLLPDLQQPRYYHACGYYHTDGQLASLTFYFCFHLHFKEVQTMT